jgi:hypothetical protein
MCIVQSSNSQRNYRMSDACQRDARKRIGEIGERKDKGEQVNNYDLWQTEGKE